MIPKALFENGDQLVLVLSINVSLHSLQIFYDGKYENVSCYIQTSDCPPYEVHTSDIIIAIILQTR